MNLQLALDRLSKDECFCIAKELDGFIDWIEIGTGVIKEYGMSIVRDMKEAHPYKIIVADMKTCDAGTHETIQAFESGADITTVMAFSDDATIFDSLSVAKEYNKRVMVDLLGVSDSSRIMVLDKLGVDLVSLHFGKDMQRQHTIERSAFALVEKFPHIDVAVAGGVTLHTLPELVKENPFTVIVGSALTKDNNRLEIAKQMKGWMNPCNN